MDCSPPLSMEFSGREYWGGLPILSPGDIPGPGMEPTSPALQLDPLPSEPPGKSVDIKWTMNIMPLNRPESVPPLPPPVHGKLSSMRWAPGSERLGTAAGPHFMCRPWGPCSLVDAARREAPGKAEAGLGHVPRVGHSVASPPALKSWLSWFLFPPARSRAPGHP